MCDATSKTISTLSEATTPLLPLLPLPPLPLRHHLQKYSLPNDYSTNVIAYSPGGTIIAACYVKNTRSSTVNIINLIDGKKKELPFNHAVRAICFSADGCQLLVGGTNKRVTIFDMETFEKLCDIKRHHTVISIACSRDGRKFAIGDYGGTLGLFRNTNYANDIEKLKSFNCESNVYTVCFSMNSKYVVGGGNAKKIFVFNTKTFELAAKLNFSERILSSSFSPSGEFLAVAGDDTNVTIIETKNWTFHRVFRRSADVESVSFSSDSHEIAAGGSDKMVFIYNAKHGGIVSKIECDGHVSAVAFSPLLGEDHLAVGGYYSSWNTYTANKHRQVDCIKEINITKSSLPSKINSSLGRQLRLGIIKRMPGNVDTYFPSWVTSYATGQREGVDSKGCGPGMWINSEIIRCTSCAGIEAPMTAMLFNNNNRDWREAYLLRLSTKSCKLMGVSSAKVMVVLLTTALFNSNSCLDEIDVAIKNGMKLIILRCEDDYTDSDDKWIPKWQDDDGIKKKTDFMLKRQRVVRFIDEQTSIPKEGNTIFSQLSAIDTFLIELRRRL